MRYVSRKEQIAWIQIISIGACLALSACNSSGGGEGAAGGAGPSYSGASSLFSSVQVETPPAAKEELQVINQNLNKNDSYVLASDDLSALQTEGVILQADDGQTLQAFLKN